MMKKLTILFMSLILVCSLVGCGSNKQEKNSTSASTSQSEDQSIAETEKSEETTEDSADTEEKENEGATGKTLVVYYSASGNTEEVANYIAEASDADTFEIQPTEPYSDEDLDWTNEDSRVSYEHDNPDARTVELETTDVPDWESYDTVYIGYPIWWGIAAWPVDGFVKSNDFTGKTVVPFCTSASSGLGESGELLEKMAGTGDWLSGERFRSGASEEDVKAWVQSLGL